MFYIPSTLLWTRYTSYTAGCQRSFISHLNITSYIVLKFLQPFYSLLIYSLCDCILWWRRTCSRLSKFSKNLGGLFSELHFLFLYEYAPIIIISVQYPNMILEFHIDFEHDSRCKRLRSGFQTDSSSEFLLLSVNFNLPTELLLYNRLFVVFISIYPCLCC